MIKPVRLEERLQYYFNYPSFKMGQKEIITDVLKGQDVLGILPTGSGKSICYQLAAKLLPGTTVVVSPLISLMIDQVRELKAMHFKEVVALNSFVDYKDRKQLYENLAAYKLIYLSPELLQQSDVLTALKRVQIDLFVIDEAHCISQWGHEFRPDYLKLNDAIKALDNPPILALSATATKRVQRDILQSLERKEVVEHIYPMDRPNIAFALEDMASDREKTARITEVLSEFNVPTLIYFSSRQATEDVSAKLSDNLAYKKIAFYHGGMEPLDRIAIQQQFMNDQLDVICCTSAFGMGINKSNIRLVIHYHFPAQLESYIQEVGRAGRDGSASTSLLLYSQDDDYLPRRMIANELPEEAEIRFVFNRLFILARENKGLPQAEADVSQFFQVNEVQWRFLNSQLEKHGIIKNDRLAFDLKKWEQAMQAIIRYRHERYQLKQSNLTLMLEWLKSATCLRASLYHIFQDTYQEPTSQCCSNCGFFFTKWRPVEQTKRTDIPETWEARLQKLLQIEVHNETS